MQAGAGGGVERRERLVHQQELRTGDQRPRDGDALLLADRIMVMQPRPGRVFDELENPQTRPRDRLSPAFEASKREVLRTLERSLRDDQPQQHKAAESAGMWW